MERIWEVIKKDIPDLKMKILKIKSEILDNNREKL